MPKIQIEPTNERGGKSKETDNRRLDAKTIRAIECVLSKGDRAEVLPAPGGGVKVIHIQKTLVSDTGKKKK